MKTSVQARLDEETQAALDRLVRRQSLTPSEVVREGIRLMDKQCAAPPRRKLIGIGMFDSGIPTSQPTRNTWRASAQAAQRRRCAVKPALVDASFLVAVYNRSDFHHSRCARVHEVLDQPLVTCEPVIAESIHLLRYAQGGGCDPHRHRTGVLEIPFKLNESAGRVQSILKKYGDTPADFADACLIVMADELDTGDILTLDRDFAHYRWRRTRAFHLLIPLD